MRIRKIHRRPFLGSNDSSCYFEVVLSINPHIVHHTSNNVVQHLFGKFSPRTPGTRGAETTGNAGVRERAQRGVQGRAKRRTDRAAAAGGLQRRGRLGRLRRGNQFTLREVLVTTLDMFSTMYKRSRHRRQYRHLRPDRSVRSLTLTPRADGGCTLCPVATKPPRKFNNSCAGFLANAAVYHPSMTVLHSQ